HSNHRERGDLIGQRPERQSRKEVVGLQAKKDDQKRKHGQHADVFGVPGGAGLTPCSISARRFLHPSPVPPPIAAVMIRSSPPSSRAHVAVSRPLDSTATRSHSAISSRSSLETTTM